MDAIVLGPHSVIIVPGKEIPEPYTEVIGETNIKPREVRCMTCHYIIVTNLPNPKCGKCRNNLMTVIESID